MAENSIRTAIIIGAGRKGSLAVKLLKDYEQIFFCDNNEDKIGMIIEGVKVKSFDELKKMYQQNDVDIYIAGYVHEIYEQCVCNGIKIVGVYDSSHDKMVPYKAYCIQDKRFYCNSSYIVYKKSKQMRVENNIAKFLNGEQMSKCITEVAIELSNLCNYACFHKKCPASKIDEKIIMPLSDIKEIIEQLVRMDFKGTICFQIYNEPLIDPRLFLIIEYVKKKLADVKVLLYTNGYYLTNSLVKDIQSGFGDIIVATAYGEEEFIRLINLNISIPYYVLWGNLDNRLLWQKELKKSKCNVPCISLFSQLPIWANGDVGLCCIDCFQKAVLGNIREVSLQEIINDIEIRKYMESLLQGRRQEVKYCSICEWEGIRRE